MFSIYENNKKISGACRSFVLCLDYVGLSPFICFKRNRRNRLRFVYTHFKSCDQSLDKISFDFSYIFRAMQSCAMCTKSKTIFKLPKGMVT